jgi:GNAT superfamily N-acetyltransferase
MFRAAWLEHSDAVLVAYDGGDFAGSYFLKPNFPGTAARIANAGYLVAPDLRNRGIGAALLEHSLDQARRLGYRSMMFNLVFERNPSRRLWQRFGFEVIGRIPDAVNSEAALIYWRRL